MGRRAKNKQGDPLPLDADPDLKGFLNTSNLKTRPGFKGRPSPPNLKSKLGKRKPERDNEEEPVAKKPKGAQFPGKSKPQARAALTKTPAASGKAKSNGKKVHFEEDGATDEEASVRWEDVEAVNLRAEARCVSLAENVDIFPLTNNPP